MLSSALVDALVAHLNTNKTKWTTESITVKAELDPYFALLPTLGVYILPGYTQYSGTEGNRGRTQVIQILPQNVISLVVSQRFTDIPATSTDGVVDWTTAKTIIDIRERAERVLMTYASSSLTLVDIDPQALQEAELDVRNFVAVTFFTWEDAECVSEQDLP